MESNQRDDAAKRRSSGSKPAQKRSSGGSRKSNSRLSKELKGSPIDRIEVRAVADLVRDARNARKHSDAQVAMIARSVTEFGWTTRVLIDEGGKIIAGHGRVLAAEHLGLSEVPVMVAVGWTDQQKRAYALADNQIPLHADWDPALLKLEIDELKFEGVDLDLLGFDAATIAKLKIGPEEAGDASPQLSGLEYSVVVRCADEPQQAELLARMEQEGFSCQALIS